LQAHQPVIHAAKHRPRESDHVHLNAAAVEAIHQLPDQSRRFVRVVEGAIKEVNAQQADCLLLPCAESIQHFNVHNDFRKICPRPVLKANTEPAMPPGRTNRAVRSHGIGEYEQAAIR
jgi:hypothetical protein